MGYSNLQYVYKRPCDTLINWLSINPVIPEGVEVDVKGGTGDGYTLTKTGDGVNTFADLPYSGRTGKDANGSGGYPEVSSFSLLPDPSIHENEIYVVKSNSGILMAKKDAGLYISNGIAWQFLGGSVDTATIVVNGQNISGHPEFVGGEGVTLVTDLASSKVTISVDKSEIGLNRVDNTPDYDKPLSRYAIEALNAKAQNTLATPSTDGLMSAVDKSTLNTLASMGGSGQSQSQAVSSVAGKTGNVLLTKQDVGLGNVDNTSDIDKPLSTAVLAALSDLSSVASSGSYADLSNKPSKLSSFDNDLLLQSADQVSALILEETNRAKSAELALSQASELMGATIAADTDSKIATAVSASNDRTDAKLTEILGTAPSTLNTLGELAAQMASDETALSSLTNLIGTKASSSDLSAEVARATAAEALAISIASEDATAKANAAQSASTPVEHASNTSNPHSVTKTQVGLGNVDNTSDSSKPVSTAQASANAAVLSSAKAYADTTSASAIASAKSYADSQLATKAGIATSLAGYGIADAYTKTVIDNALSLKATTSALASVATAGTFASLTAKPTTLAGYGVADAYTAAQVDAKISSNARFKNRIINGSFTVNQRVYSSNTSLSSGTYGHDRWKAGASGCTYVFTQPSVVAPISVSITSGSLQQVIEGCNIPDGGAFTLSWGGTAQGRVNGGAYSASPLTVTGITAGNNVTIEFGTGTVSLPQFEPGTTATGFEYLPHGANLELCQRYFEVTDVSAHGVCYSGNGDTRGSQVSFKVTKRAIPTITFSTTAIVIFAVGNGGSGFNYNATISAYGASVNSWWISTLGNANNVGTVINSNVFSWAGFANSATAYAACEL